MVRPLSYYASKWDDMRLTRPEQTNRNAHRIIANWPRYKKVERKTGVPAEFVGALHMRESANSFAGVLHNGDRIIGTGRKTYRVPKGRGPFSSWEAAAMDALKMKGWLGKAKGYWTPARQLQQGERYNGMGYARRGAPSPYVFAGTQYYRRGKYVRDGVYSASHVDRQLGIAPVIKQVMELQGTNRVPGSRRDGFLAVWQRLIETVGIALGFLWQQLGMIRDFLTQNQLLILLGCMGIMWMIIRTSRKQTLREYREGRYTPSGEANDGPDTRLLDDPDQHMGVAELADSGDGDPGDGGGPGVRGVHGRKPRKGAERPRTGTRANRRRARKSRRKAA